jgi:isopentenyldiphosphate isomerase
MAEQRLERDQHLMGDDSEEVFDLVDERDVVIGQVRRGDAHHNPDLIHRSVQVLVFDRQGRLLLQRRSLTKDLFAGYYCASASGHVAAGDEYACAAKREVSEELGVSLALTPLGKTLVRSAYETEWTSVFVARSDGPFHFHHSETDGGEFFTPAALVEGRATSGALRHTPALVAALEMLSRFSLGAGLFGPTDFDPLARPGV